MIKKYITSLVYLLLVQALFAGALMAQRQQSVFDQHETFMPINYPSGDLYRSAAGKPGPHYWQNRADYQIRASFDTTSRKLSAKLILTYINNSPDVLPYIWCSLGQNRFRKDSRTTATTPLSGSRFGIQEFTDGFVLNAVQIQNGTKAAPVDANYRVANDYLKIMLSNPLKPGAQVSLIIDYNFTLPFNGSDFMGVLPTKNGAIYQFSTWFPRIVVYDNIKGWNVDNAGYYVEPGKLDYTITVPAEMIVQGTGQLDNPEQVLTKTQLQRFQAAQKSDATVQIRTAAEVVQPSSRPSGKQLTWHFSANNAGDGLFAISRSFIWDAVKVNLPNKQTALAMSLYPVESNYQTWQESAMAMKEILETYSRLWTPFPYTTMVNIAGPVTGIGGPAASFIHYQSNGMANGVWPKVNHELGHTWFNMMVAGNGRQGWMVEGMNSLINHINGDTLNKQTAFFMADAVEWQVKAKPNEPVVTPYDIMQSSNFALLAYVKPALALNLLRTQVLGPTKFDQAFREYIRAWTFKHPTPNDFFRCMENATAEDLSWFWQSWFLNNWTLDQAIASVDYVEGSPSKGINIKLLNKGKMVMPTVIEVIQFNGKVERITLPAQIWQKGPEWTVHYPSTSTVIAVKIDPDKTLPDADITNNTWQGNNNCKPIPQGITAANIVERYLSAIGGRDHISKIKKVDLNYHLSIQKAEYVFNRTAALPNVYSIEMGFANIGQSLQKFKIDGSRVSCQEFGGAEAKLDEQQSGLIAQVCTLLPETHFLDQGYKLTLADSTRNINGMDAYILKVDHAGQIWTYYYDVRSGLKIKESYNGTKGDILPYQTLEMAEYKASNGLMLPGTLILKKTNEPDLLLRTKQVNIEINN